MPVVFHASATRRGYGFRRSLYPHRVSLYDGRGLDILATTAAALRAGDSCSPSRYPGPRDMPSTARRSTTLRSAMPRPAAPLRTRGARAEGHTGRGREVGTSRPGSCSHDDAHADALARVVEQLRVRPRRVCAPDNDDDEVMPPTLEAVPASPNNSSPPSVHAFPPPGKTSFANRP